MSAAFFRLALFGVGVLGLVACNGAGSSTAPAPESEVASSPARLPGTVALGSPQMQGEASLIPAAMWDVTIDVESLTASVGKRPDERTGQTYAETYLMDVTRYFTPSVMAIEGVTRTATDRIKVDYTIAHPFPAATNPDGPATATNRGDLGFTGIVMFPLDVVDESPIVYFAETDRPIIANTEAVATADGYYVPAGLVYGLDMQANCFPFRRLVNDARRESRIGIPLDNLGVGNFDPEFGWQRANWGPTHTGWTGYGALHQGQVARNSVELNLPVDPISSISLTVMLIAKYLDPVGPGSSPADRAANRLPSSDGDRTKFLYRMPQAAWDLERIEVRVDGEFEMSGSSEVTLQVRVTDWDAKADTTQSTLLGDDPKAGYVEQGEKGWPSFVVSVPTLANVAPETTTVLAGFDLRVNNDVELGGDTEPDDGGADDPLFFRIPLTDFSDTARIPREHRGMLQVRDAAWEAQHDVPIDHWLGPLSAGLPQLATYQTFSLNVQGVEPELELRLKYGYPEESSGNSQTLTVRLLTGGQVLSGNLIIDWNGDGDYCDEREPVILPLDVTERDYWGGGHKNPTLESMPATINVLWWVDDGLGARSESLDFSVGPNRPPVVGGGTQGPSHTMLESQRASSPATFRWNAPLLYVGDREEDPITYVVRRLDTGEIVTSDSLPMAMTAVPIMATVDTFVPFEFYLSDPLHPGIEGTLIWTQTLRVDDASPSGWSKKLQHGAAYPEVGDLCIDDSGNQYVLGRLAQAFDFGGGVLQASGAYVASFTPEGTHRWSREFLSAPVTSIGVFFISGEVNEAGSLILGNLTQESTDFGGGPTPRTSVGVVALDAATGDYQWNRAWIVPGIEIGPHLVLSTNGEVTLAGSLGNPGVYSFGGPPRTLTERASPYVLRLTATGDYLWDYSATGGWTTTWGFAEDGTGALYLAGTHQGDVDFGAGIQPSEERVPWLLSLASGGSFRWNKVFANGGNGGGYCSGIAGSRSTGCLVSGFFGPPIDLGSGTAVETGDGFRVRYGGDGEWLWEHLDAGYVYDIDVLSAGDFVLAGQFSGQADLGFGPIQAEGALDSYVVRTTDAGLPRWSSMWHGDDYNYSTEVAVQDDRIALLAAFEGLVDLDPTPGQFFNKAATVSDHGDHFLITLRAETGQW